MGNPCEGRAEGALTASRGSQAGQQIQGKVWRQGLYSVTELLLKILEAPGSVANVTKKGRGKGWLNVGSEDKIGRPGG
jgi:hypothetical protein